METIVQVIIENLAPVCVASLIAEGWDPSVGGYSIAVYHGDREALRYALDREPEDEELRALETEIRAALSRRAECRQSGYINEFERPLTDVELADIDMRHEDRVESTMGIYNCNRELAEGIAGPIPNSGTFGLTDVQYL